MEEPENHQQTTKGRWLNLAALYLGPEEPPMLTCTDYWDGDEDGLAGDQE